MKRCYLFIVANKDQCISMIPELLVSSSTTNTDPSGVVLIMACVFDNTKLSFPIFDAHDFSCIKSCKPNILKGSSHHGSVGYYASFGNKGSFDKVVHSSPSVGQYAWKKNSNPNKQYLISMRACRYEEQIALEIDSCVNRIGRVIPNIRCVISPVIDTAFEIQKERGHINLQSTLTSENGCWQTSICINAQTKDFHNEHDCTYTLITVPDQDYFHPPSTNHNYQFLFKISKTDMIHIDMVPGVSFMFSGVFLTHRQNKKINSTSSNEVLASDQVFAYRDVRRACQTTMIVD